MQSLNIHQANVHKMLSCVLIPVLLKFCPLTSLMKHGESCNWKKWYFVTFCHHCIS